MQEIDFLPAEYRRQHTRRQQQPWRVLVVLAFLGVLGAAGFAQSRLRRQVESELAAVGPARAMAAQRQTELAQLQTRLATARARADLITYLRHPWPRTQLIRAVLTPLPEAVTLDRLQISRQVAPGRPGAAQLSRAERESEQQQLDRLPPAGRDLERLRAECDEVPVQISIGGIASQSAAVHDYLSALGRTDLFLKAELHSLEADPRGNADQLRFEASIVVRPGYGQADGPTGGGRNSAAVVPRKQVGGSSLY
jgi:Tfp pilus assembly protein PilN